jgi:hypothetical protein
MDARRVGGMAVTRTEIIDRSGVGMLTLIEARSDMRDALGECMATERRKDTGVSLHRVILGHDSSRDGGDEESFELHLDWDDMRFWWSGRDGVRGRSVNDLDASLSR